jgi:hypothetical protein
LDDSALEVSVVIRTVGGAPFVERALRALLPQIDAACEVLVPFDATLRDEMSRVEQALPMFRYVDMGAVNTLAPQGSGAADHELYDRRTSAGFCRARGRILASLEDYGVPADDWIEQIRLAHETLPHGVIGGCVEQASGRLLNWAVYYLDFGRFQPPLAEGPAAYLSDVNVSYKRETLESVRPLWEERYNEARVHWELQRRGTTLWQRPQIAVYQDRGPLTWRRVLRERYSWGRLFGAVRAREHGRGFRLLYAALSPFIPLVLVGRMLRKTLVDRRHVGRFCAALPALLLLAVVWCAGEMVGYVTGRAEPSGGTDADRR